VRQLSLEAVAAGCRAESRQSRKHEAGFCFELFRRALEERDQGAWLALDEQYRYLLLGWVQALRPEPETAEEAAREALERFWRTLAPRADPLEARFAHVGALLKYLQQCAVTTVLDRRRREQQRSRLDERLRAAPPAAGPSLEEDAVERLARNEQIARVRGWIAAEVRDPLELRVLQLSYEQGLSPVEIAARFPAEFANVELVRQIKERVLRRARRALLDGGSAG
jgi:DNA-directed RNA polymerase specialized sigma24 family protein